MSEHDHREAREARIGADRMALGLPCVPDPIRGDMTEIESLRTALAAATERAEKAEARSPGTWPAGSHRAFVDGAKWWQAHHGGATAFPSERDEMEAEAERRFGPVTDEDRRLEQAEADRDAAKHLEVCASTLLLSTSSKSLATESEIELDRRRLSNALRVFRGESPVFFDDGTTRPPAAAEAGAEMPGANGGTDAAS